MSKVQKPHDKTSLLPADEVMLLIRQVVAEWGRVASSPASTPVSVNSILPLTPDASLRRYFRVTLSGSQSATTAVTAVPARLVAMYFDSVTAAEAGTGPSLASDAAYVAFTDFFLAHNVQVARLLYDARDRRLLLIEDLGDTLIGNLIGKLPPAELEIIYQAALEQLMRIQAIPTGTNPLAGNIGGFRAFSRELFLKEMLETADFFLPAFDPSAHLRQQLIQQLETLASKVDALPKLLAHRDYHSWNLMWSDNKLRVIDFQDALLAPRTYDLISLLHDRDTDLALGAPLVTKLASDFQKRSDFAADFHFEYTLALLQRDLKVVGRFAKLVTVRHLTNYSRWIPGTFRRVIDNLRKLSAITEESDWEKLAGILAQTAGSDPGAPFRV